MGKTKASPQKVVNEIRKKTSTFKYFAPTNYDQEKQKFLASESYNPQFKYKPFPIHLFKKNLEQLENLHPVKNDSIEAYIINRKIEETKYKLQLLISRGEPEGITLASEKLYQCKFNKNYVAQAKKTADLKAEFNEHEIKPNKVRNTFREYLQRYKINEWKIVISRQKDFNIQVRFKKELIRISEDINLDFTSLDSLIAHEIDGHIVRAINTLNQKQKTFRSPLPFYIKTEEGLASYLGDYFAEDSKLSRKHHAIKYLGAFIALNNSFREVYNYFLDKGFTQDLAFQRAFRIKRGFTDTSLPGCNAREAIYWEGMIDVKKYLNRGGSLKKLYAGKSGLKDVDLVPTDHGVVIPKRIHNKPKLNFTYPMMS